MMKIMLEEDAMHNCKAEKKLYLGHNGEYLFRNIEMSGISGEPKTSELPTNSGRFPRYVVISKLRKTCIYTTFSKTLWPIFRIRGPINSTYL